MPLDTGVSTITDAQDLVAKLDRDLALIRRNSTDVDGCINFFLTADRIPEWRFSRDAERIVEFRRQHALVRACAQLASGAKCFRVSEKRPTTATAPSSAAVATGAPVFAAVGRGAVRQASKLVELVLDVDPAEAIELGPVISARELAERVAQFWRSQMADSEPSPPSMLDRGRTVRAVPATPASGGQSGQ